MEEHTKITHTPSITLKKGMQKNTYGWEIRIADDDLKKVVEELEEINNQLLNKFKKEGVKKKK